MILKPKNWEKFQHYKDRNPPWIKVHKEQLDDPDFMSLSLASIGLSQMLWLLASESKDGSFDASMKKLTFRLRKTQSEITKLLNPLISSGFFVVLSDASSVLALDTESCSETETETEHIVAFDAEESFEKIWQEYPAKDGKKTALRSYKSTVKTSDDAQDVIIALSNYKKHLAYESWKKPKNGSTWFNNWEDWVDWIEPKELPQTSDENIRNNTGLCY